MLQHNGGSIGLKTLCHTSHGRLMPTHLDQLLTQWFGQNRYYANIEEKEREQ
jgi:hypothetical protein